MRIIRQSDSAFHRDPYAYGGNTPEEEWLRRNREGVNFDDNDIQNHESFPDALDLGFAKPTDWRNRLYKVDQHKIIHEIYPRGHAFSQRKYDNGIPWVMRVSNIPETPDLIVRHKTLDDALNQHRNQSWMRGIQRPAFDDYDEAFKRAPAGVPFVTRPFARILDPAYTNEESPYDSGGKGRYLEQRDKTINDFHDAWDEGMHDPYSR